MDNFFGLDKVSTHPDNFELLATASDSVQLTIIESILKDAKIPYFSKDRGCGTAVKVISGFSVFGTDIFVLKEDFEKASALIGPMSVSNEGITFEDDNGEEKDN